MSRDNKTEESCVVATVPNLEKKFKDQKRFLKIDFRHQNRITTVPTYCGVMRGKLLHCFL
jgi:hypothetical protein